MSNRCFDKVLAIGRAIENDQLRSLTTAKKATQHTFLPILYKLKEDQKFEALSEMERGKVTVTELGGSKNKVQTILK